MPNSVEERTTRSDTYHFCNQSQKPLFLGSPFLETAPPSNRITQIAGRNQGKPQ
jgi:hypothetical protein